MAVLVLVIWSMIAGKYLPVHHWTYMYVKAAASLSTLLLLDCFSLRMEMAGFMDFMSVP